MAEGYSRQSRVKNEDEKKINVTMHPHGNEFEPGKPNSVPGEHYINFSLAPGEYLVQCPYDKSHRILPYRMGRHMYRCRTNYEDQLKEKGLGIRWVMCPFTERHLIPEMELQYHSAQCDYRGKTKEELEAYKTYCPPRPPNYSEIQKLITEDWGDEFQDHRGTYNPQHKLESEPILYFEPKGLCKTKKRAFRDKQRQKFYHLVSNDFYKLEQSSYTESDLGTEASSTAASDYGSTTTVLDTKDHIEDAGSIIAKFIDDPSQFGKLSVKDDEKTQIGRQAYRHRSSDKPGPATTKPSTSNSKK